MAAVTRVGAAMLVALAATAAACGSAGTPHFVADSVRVRVRGRVLHVVFTEAGLEKDANESVVLRATASTTYRCGTSTGYVATYPSQVEGHGSYTVDKNGEIDGIQTVAPPAAARQCPFESVAYSGVSLSDANGVSLAIPGTFRSPASAAAAP